MTKKQAIEILKTKGLRTNILKTLNISFEGFLRFAQYNEATQKRILTQLIIGLEREVNNKQK